MFHVQCNDRNAESEPQRRSFSPRATDARILEAADRLIKGGFLTPILVGNVDAVKAAAAKGGF